MKLNLPATLMIFVGVLLIYSAYKKEDPRKIVGSALGLDVKGWDSAGKAVAEGIKKIPIEAKPNPNTPGQTVVTV